MALVPTRLRFVLDQVIVELDAEGPAIEVALDSDMAGER
jgi:hypothetical protein